MNPALNQAEINATATSRRGLRDRLVRGLSATALGPVVTALIQLGSVPAPLYAWGAVKYGDWLLLSAIPSYLALSDFCFGDASGSDLSVRGEANRQYARKFGKIFTSRSAAALVSVWTVNR